MSHRVAWLLWFLTVFGLFNSCAGHDEDTATRAAIRRGTLRFDVAGALKAARIYGTDDGDIRRYHAYVNALLGRPYQSHYVRPLAAWLDEFRSPDAEHAPGPDERPTLTPPAPLLPWRDFLVEYPPGFFVWALLPALVTRDVDAYTLLFASWMALLLTVALWLCGRLEPLLPPSPIATKRGRVPDVVAWATALVFAIGVVATRRFDAVVSLLLCAACWASFTRRPLLAGAALGLAVASKLVPLIAAPPLVLLLWRRQRRGELARAVVAAVVVTAALMLPPLVWAGRGMLDVLRYHGDRPLQVESTGAALLGLVRLIAPSVATPAWSYGSHNVTGPWVGVVGGLTTPLTVAALALVWLVTWRRLGTSDTSGTNSVDRQAHLTVLRGVVASLAVYMALGKVFSPQYLVWLLPLGVVVSLAQAGASRWIFLAITILTQLIYPIGYHSGLVPELHPVACVLVLGRNLLLLYWAWLMVRGERRVAGTG